MMNKLILAAVVLLFGLSCRIAYAGINDPDFGSTAMSAKNIRQIAKVSVLNLSKKEKYKTLSNGTKVFGAQKIKEQCGSITIIGAKNQDLYVGGTVVNTAKCR